MKTSDANRILSIAHRINDGKITAEDPQQFTTEESEKIFIALQKISFISKRMRTLSKCGAETIKENDKWAHLAIKNKIGAGGIGEVFRAFDPALNCEVAVKFLNTKSQLYISQQQFLQEARTMAKVRHPHVLAIHGATVDKNIAGYWSDYLDGQLLSEKLLEQNLDKQQQFVLIQQLSNALKQIHKNNLVHGDIKAQNVILQPHRGAILLDFGSSRKHEAENQDNQIFQASPLSMAPEQFQGIAQSKQSDIFSLGLLFWNISTGEHPLDAKNIKGVERQIGNLAIKKHLLSGSKAWKKLLLSMLATEPHMRPSIERVIDLLAEIEQKPLKRAKKITYAAIMALALIVSSVSLYSNYQTKKMSNEARALNDILADTLMKSSSIGETKTMLSVDILSEAQQMLIDNQLISKQQKINSLFHLVKTYAFQDKHEKTIALSSFLLADEEITSSMTLNLLVYKSHALSKQKDYKQAEQLLLAANKIIPKTQQDIKLKISAITSLVDQYNKNQQLEKVPLLLKQARKWWRKSDKNFGVLAKIEMLQGNYYEMGLHYQKALNYYQLALTSQEKFNPSKNLPELIIQATLGANLMRKPQTFIQGEQYLKNSITEFMLILGASDASTLSARLFIAELYANQEMYQQAVNSLVPYIPNFYKLYDQDFDKIFNFQMQLLNYYLQAGQHSDAKEMLGEINNSYYLDELKINSEALKDDLQQLHNTINANQVETSVKLIKQLQFNLVNGLVIEPWKARRENLQYPHMELNYSDKNSPQHYDKITNKPFNWAVGSDQAFTVATQIELNSKDTVINAMQKGAIKNWDLKVGELPVQPQAYDAFGTALTSGDFNADGFLDLAIGVPNADYGEHKYTGLALILYGASTGLNSRNSHLLFQQPDIAKTHDAFASSLASGDFNGDGFKDLAVGIPYKDIENLKDAGAIAIYYGSSSGLTTKAYMIHEPNPTRNAQYGWSMTTADFNQNGMDELVVSAPQKDIIVENKTYRNAGMVYMHYGSPQGLSDKKQINITQNSENMLDSVDSYDQFGWSLATGNFDQDNNFDLAIGIPFESVESNRYSGMVQIINGSENGLSNVNEVWSQYNRNISGMGESGDRFGYALATGDYNGDKIDDIIIGVPGEDYFSSGVVNGGVAHIIFGTQNGLSDANNQMLIQNASQNNDMAEDSDQFGKVITMADINSDGFDDVIIGVPDEDIGNHIDSGLVQVIYGNSRGTIDDKSNYFCKQQNGQCGQSILAGNFGNKSSLITASPGWLANNTKPQAGRVIQVTYSATDNTLLDSVFTK